MKIMEGANIKESIKAGVTMKGMVLRWATLLLLAGSVCMWSGCGGSSDSGSSSNSSGGSSSSSNVITGATIYAAYKLDGGTNSTTDTAYNATAADTSAIYVTNGGTLTLTDPTITTSGDSSSTENSSFYGLNAAVLADGGSTLTMNGGTITTSGSGANGAYSYGSGTTVTISDATINATGGGGHGVMAVGGGTMILNNVTQETWGASSSVIALDKGGGTITVTGGTATAHGQNSAALYSTGVLTVTDSTLLTSDGAEAAVIEGSNSITVTDSNLSSTYPNKWGVMLYQSGSGDASGTDGYFTMTGGSLSYVATSYNTYGGPLLYNTNSTAYWSLSGVTATAGSGIFLKACKCDWGNSTAASAGGVSYLDADDQTMVGDLVVDDDGSITASLTNSSSLTGAINEDNYDGTVSLTLDSTSSWTATATSYVDTLNGVVLSGTTATNIIGSATIYYSTGTDSNGNALSGNYTLLGGGTLKQI